MYQAIDVNAFKRRLRERLPSGWLIVTGDPGCTNDFVKRYYGYSEKDVEDRLVVITIRDRRGVHKDIDLITLVKNERAGGVARQCRAGFVATLQKGWKRVQAPCRVHGGLREAIDSESH